jgi:D-threo-aldose 1-dehydrogenase
MRMDVSKIFPKKTFGLGGVPFGNEFAYVTDEVAYSTVQSAWEAGVRY